MWYNAGVDLLDSPVSMLMSTDDLVVVERDQSLLEVWDLMIAAHIQHVPVVDGDELVGLVSSWDLARLAVDRGAASFEDLCAGEVMEKSLVRLSPRASLRQAASLLAEGGFHCLPVADDQNLLVGILTTTDVIRYVATGKLRDA